MSVHQHWDPLEACLVGKSYSPEFYSYIENPKVRNAFEKIAIETEEDYQKIISKLEEFNVEIVRMDVGSYEDYYDKEKNKNDLCRVCPPMQPRDFTAMVGNRFFMPGPDFCNPNNIEGIYYGMLHDWDKTPERIHDEQVMAKFILDAMLPGRPHDLEGSLAEVREEWKDDIIKNGTCFLSHLDMDAAKKLILAAETNTIGSNNRVNRDLFYDVWNPVRKWCDDNGVEKVYDQYINSANMWRIGKDLYFGLVNIVKYIDRDNCVKKWQNLFPDYRINILDSPGHCDGGMHPIKPGLIASVNHPDTHKFFPGWDIVPVEPHWEKMHDWRNIKNKNRGRWWIEGEENNKELEEFVDAWMNDWVNYAAESIFDVNMLVIDENNVICNNYNERLFKKFDEYNVTPHVINFRHRYFWDGGLHCITSDLKRKGEQGDFSYIKNKKDS